TLISVAVGGAPMSTVAQPAVDQRPGQGVRVDIGEHSAFAVSGWFGVLVLAVCAGASVLLAPHHNGWLWLPILVFVLVAASLVIVTPGQTSVVQFFGRYIGTVRRAGFWWLLP